MARLYTLCALSFSFDTLDGKQGQSPSRQRFTMG